MAEYYAVLSKAVAGLEAGSQESRRAVYDKARNALIGQLKAIDPPLPTAEISRQRLELEEAIRRVERESAGTAPASPAGADRDRAPAAGGGQAAVPDQGPPVSPQDMFRRAIQDAAGRGGIGAGQSPVMERAPVPARADHDGASGRQAGYGDMEPVERAPPDEPPYVPPYREETRAPAEARLAPDYDYEWEQRPARATADPYVDQRDRPAAGGRRGRGGGRKSRGADRDLIERRARPSRLPAILLLLLIVAMAGGLAAFAWSQQDKIRDLLAYFDATSEQSPAPVEPAAVEDADAAQSGKDPDRLLDGGPDGGMRVVEPQPTIDSIIAGSDSPVPVDDTAVDIDTMVAQSAALYEEPLDAAAAANGVVAFEATVVWRYEATGPDGPEIQAEINVPQRSMKVKLAIRKNVDETLPASHIVEMVVDTPADFPGQGIRNIPRLVLKPGEDAAGQPLIGAPALVAQGLYWIVLSGVSADVTTNLGLLRDRSWIDLHMVYGNGQRAILNFEKGVPGERVFERALAAWGG
jgi:hypothetical protein